MRLLLAVVMCSTVTTLAFPAWPQEAAQETAPEAIERLTRENQELRQRLEALEQQVQQLQVRLPPPGGKEVSEEELLQPTVSGVERAPTGEQPGGGGNLNPDIAVVGDFVVNVGDSALMYPKTRTVNREIEFNYTQRLSPAARVWVTPTFHSGADHEQADVEEAFIDFDRLVDDFDFRAGRLRLKTSQYNFAHTHELPFVNSPLVITNFFGEEGAVGDGGWVTYALPTRGNLGLTAGLFDNDNMEGAFGTPGDGRLFWGSLTGSTDWTGGKNQFYWTVNYLHGGRFTPPYGSRDTDLYSAELAYRHQKDQWRRFEARGEYLTASLGGPRRYRRDGGYLNLLYRWPDEHNRKREAGLLLERTHWPEFQKPGAIGAASAYYTWQQTERIQFRTQYTRLFGDCVTDRNDDLFFFQLDWLLGFHPPHD